jgi:N-acylneuraminate cytidylyltransferase
MRRFAFIFARGGSKGLKEKNIKIFLDQPLITYSIKQAINCKIFEKVFVSTDNEKIANISLLDGAEVIDRPFKLAQDNSPEWLAWQHAISYAEKKYGIFDQFVSLPPTSPLRSNEDILSACEMLEKTKDSNACIAISPSSRNPYFNMVKRNKDNIIERVCKTDSNVTRRQDAPSVFDITTAVYAVNVDFIKKSKDLFSGTVLSIEIPKERAVDIDDILDFKFAEFLYKNLYHDKR